MHNGMFYSMMNLLKLGSMALLSNVVMGLDGASVPEYLLTQLITQKSKFLKKIINVSTNQQSTYIRVLLASIWNKGRCPCPQCLILLLKVHQVGTVSDQSK